MEAGFQAIVNCMLEAGWQRSEVMRSLRRLIAADKTPRSRPSLAIARAMIRSGKAL